MPFWRTLIFGQSSYHINLTRPGSELWLNINAANFKAVSKESSVAVCFPLCPLSGYVFCMLSILNHNLNRVREIFRKYRCKSVQFGALWGHQVIKSGTENRGILGRNLPSLQWRIQLWADRAAAPPPLTQTYRAGHGGAKQLASDTGANFHLNT